MSGRPPPKPEENLKEKFMGFFRRNKNALQNIPKSSSKDLMITPQILKDIGQECPANNRKRNIKALSDQVKSRQLEQWGTEALWMATKDLVEPEMDMESRQLVLNFLLSLIEGQLKTLGMLRGVFFNVIENLEKPEDLRIRLELFKGLSENGKNIYDFEDRAGPFLLKLMPDALTAGFITDFLLIVINIIKFNAAYIDEDILSGLVQQTCMIQNRTRSDEDMKLCQQVLDAVICYSYLPPDSLHYFVAALCHMVSKPRFCEESWELMKKLLGTHLGCKTIHTMCCMMQDKQQPVDFILLRGAVFFTGMALWGSRRVASLKDLSSAVLPSFLEVLTYSNSSVSYEVSLSISRLINKYGKDLTHITWETVFNITQRLIHQTETIPSMDPRISSEVHNMLTEIEHLHQMGHFLGPAERIFVIVESCGSKRPTESVCKLIDHHMKDIHPGQDKWIQNLHQLLDKFFRHETRTEVRKKALDMLSFVLSLNKHVYEADLIDKLVIPFFSHIDMDPDVKVRVIAAEILLILAQGCSRDEFFDLINIIEKMIRKPLLMSIDHSAEGDEIRVLTPDQNHGDVRLAVLQLIEVFEHKLYTAPPTHCKRLYGILISHMQAQYDHSYNTPLAAAIRKAVLELLLRLRADSKHRVGLINRHGGNGCTYSPYAVCVEVAIQFPTSPILAGQSLSHMFTMIDYTQTMELYIRCLQKETDWQVLSVLLARLPSVLENKTLVLSTRGTLVYDLCERLCHMVMFQISSQTRGFPRQLHNVPEGFKRSDLDNCLLPVIAAMVTYHQFLDKNKQYEVVKCLEFGLVSGVAKVCVTTLRICSLEMQDLMMRLLPSILLSLTKIAATMAMAIPVLAFLSGLVRLPQLYANFVENEYMSVFAIALPYTNPFKFSHYTVSLAHHVIAIWFIRCRMPFRKGFVKFIQRGLSHNMTQLFEENSYLRLSQQNQDSSHRNRSGSEGTSFRRRFQSSSAAIQKDVLPPVDEKVSQFHKELRETCLDVMSRYSFGNMSNNYHRSAMAQFLLADGPSETWIVGNKLVTITTSGNRSKSSNSGLCSRCLTSLQQPQDEKQKIRQEKRRRHKSAILYRSTSEIHGESSSVGVFGSGGSKKGDDVLARCTRDDLSLLSDQTHDDVAVQTGSSLTSGADSDTLESMLLGMKSLAEKKSVITADPCPCWCEGWAEILIRGPSGNVAWVMRTENEYSQYAGHGDPSMHDIMNLFTSVNSKSPDSDSTSKLDSGSLGEEEYESVHSYIFGLEKRSSSPEADKVDNDLREENSSVGAVSTSSVSKEIEIPGRDTMVRSSSSPSVLSSSYDDTSPLGVTAALVSPHSNKPDMEAVTVKVDVSESRVMSAAGNFEGLEKSTPTSVVSGEGKECYFVPDASLESKEEKNIHDKNRSAADRTGGEENLDAYCSDEAQAYAGSVVGERGHRMSSSRLQVQLEEFDRKQEEKCGEKSASAHTPSEPTTPTNPPESSPLQEVKSSGIVIVAPHTPSRSTGHRQVVNTIRKSLPMTSPDSSSSSSTQDELMELKNIKKRGHTIAVMTRAEANQFKEADSGAKAGGGVGKSMVTPAQIFLQLYYTYPVTTSQDLPLHLPKTETFERALMMLDHIYPHETHKIGVIYVAEGQADDEKAILSNVHGSSRYTEFMLGLGELVQLEDVDQSRVYLGGLSYPMDGKFACTWKDESMQVIFHIATLMPNRKEDPNCNSKKLHIGNDFVTIVYNNGEQDFKLGTIKGQFNYVNIVIRPLDHGSNAVTLIAKQDIADILGHTHPKIVSDKNLALLVRQIAVHCNLASMVLQRQHSQHHEPFASNWLERLRKIKRIRQSVMEHLNAGAATSGQNYGWRHGVSSMDNPEMLSRYIMEDFTDYV
ncbi:tuberin-like isoform X2 [Pomacea canaliculata]|uniref:tuberin-like isoform X2 n=1 Tax=Pomacea canaliculata TaxID=400727 RepID=UPI000D732C6B|nr:tuberin-like isoform X2 [Pomacea canaliculata]